MKKILVLLVLLGMAFAVTSCNMREGAGQDNEEAGDAVQDNEEAGDAVQDATD